MVTLFVRKLTPARQKVLDRIVEFLGLKDKSKVCDLDYFDPNTIGSSSQGIAFGDVCARLVSQHVKQLWTLPPLEKLEPSEKNKDSRQKALDQMNEIKEVLSAPSVSNTNWHSVLQVGEKKVCAFCGTKPDKVEADVFISKQEYELLLRLKEAFKAEFISIVQEV